MKVFKNPEEKHLIAGPCSAESEKQLLQTAGEMYNLGIKPHYFRAGIWKPRTRPDSFQGLGVKALPWLKKVKEEYSFKTITEVANARQLEACLKHEIDAIWIGARTTVNPFTVQDIADALKGVDIPVFVKNPINPDLKLWVGALERFRKVGVNKLAAIHRGFSVYEKTKFRNAPQWQIPIDLIQEFPELELLCDTSHILGSREGIRRLAQFALDLGYSGLMIETHYSPDDALSDSRQQITPFRLKEIYDSLHIRSEKAEDPKYLAHLRTSRNKIDDIDMKIIRLFRERMEIADSIGLTKLSKDIQVFQKDRYEKMLRRVYREAKNQGLSTEFVTTIIKAAHQEAIERQKRIYEKSSHQKTISGN